MTGVRVVLASASPARLATLRQAGIEPEVVVSGVDESQLVESDPVRLAAGLARLKCEAVAGGTDGTALVIGCDSVLELDGATFGKPGDAAVAIERWRSMRGRSGTLHSGHHVVDTASGRSSGGIASTVVRFADLDDDEIEAYVATGEPLAVAGGFTVDGLGGAYVTGIDGDHHNVVGISLPLVRELVRGLGHPWHSLWNR